MRTLKRSLVLFILLAVLFVLPVWAGAETRGTCGDNLTWVLDDSGTLTISGKGAMADYGNYVRGPWGDTIKKVIIEAGVTSISAGSFGACYELTSVTIPEGVTCIGESAFSNCISLAEITIPQSVTEIGSDAFFGCTGLTSITALCEINLFDDVQTFGGSNYTYNLKKVSFPLPSLQTTLNERFTNHFPTTIEEIVLLNGGNGIIWDSYFSGCRNLTSITLPADLKTVRNNAFADCFGLMNVYAASLEAWLNISFANYSSTPMCYAENLYINGQLVQEVTIPDTITSLGLNFYGCSSLTSVSIPDSVTVIDCDAFNGCTNLVSVSLPNSITSISDYTFTCCTSLTDITIPESVTSIGAWAFYSCTSLTDITIPSSVTSIGDHAFYCCDGLTSITLPDEITSISDSTFVYCTALESLTLPAGIRSIAKGEFTSCTALKKVTFSLADTVNDDNFVFTDYFPATVEEVVITQGATKLSYGAFSNCDELKSITLPEGMTSIGSRAFYECTGLTSVSLPKSLSKIDSYVFYGCYNLREVYIPSVEDWLEIIFAEHYGSPITTETKLYVNGSLLTELVVPAGITSIGDCVFSGYSYLTSASFPEGLTSIGNRAFAGCTNLASVSLPAEITTMDEYAFSGCNISEVRIPSIVDWLQISFGSDGANPLVSGGDLNIGGTVVTELVVPEGVTAINDYAFYGSRLTSVTFSNTVTAIGEWAFYNCRELRSVSIPASVRRIDSTAFSCCTSLAEVHTPDLGAWLKISFEDAGANPLLNEAGLYVAGTLLTDAAIPQSVTSINYVAFCGCTSLRSVTLPEGVTSIGPSAFYSCSNLASISLPESLTTIGNNAFNSCTSLKRVTIPSKVTVIDQGLFAECSGLTRVDLHDGVTSINHAAFLRCSSLNGVKLPGSLTQLGTYAFSGCSSLTSLTIPNGVTSISEEALSNCTGLTSITIPESVQTVYPSSFSGCSQLRHIILPGQQPPAFSMDVFMPGFTIYCHEYSEVDYWAIENGYDVRYLDNLTSPVTFSLTTTQPRMKKGTAQTLLLTVVPEADDSAITWSSSDPAVATVEDGVVTAQAPGTVDITAACGDATASVQITVYALAESFAISPEEIWVVTKQTAEAAINVLPAGAEVSFTASSQDAAVMNASISGSTINIQALRPGDAVLTVTDTLTGLAQSCTVRVVYPVTEVTLSETETAMLCGAEKQLTATVTARDQSVINQLVTFSSSDDTVATVDRQGRVTGLAAGTATITATASSGVSASCTVSVRALYTITLPASLKILGTAALMGTDAEAYILPQGMTTISAGAFSGCTDMISVTIPDSVTSIAADAFSGCGDFTICAPEGSYAHTFALEKGISWTGE